MVAEVLLIIIDYSAAYRAAILKLLISYGSGRKAHLFSYLCAATAKISAACKAPVSTERLTFGESESEPSTRQRQDDDRSGGHELIQEMKINTSARACSAFAEERTKLSEDSVTVLLIRALKRFGVCRGIQLRRDDGRMVTGLLIEVSLEGCRVSNIGSDQLVAGDFVALAIDQGRSLSACALAARRRSRIASRFTAIWR